MSFDRTSLLSSRQSTAMWLARTALGILRVERCTFFLIVLWDTFFYLGNYCWAAIKSQLKKVFCFPRSPDDDDIEWSNVCEDSCASYCARIFYLFYLSEIKLMAMLGAFNAFLIHTHKFQWTKKTHKKSQKCIFKWVWKIHSMTPQGMAMNTSTGEERGKYY